MISKFIYLKVGTKQVVRYLMESPDDMSNICLSVFQGVCPVRCSRNLMAFRRRSCQRLCLSVLVVILIVIHVLLNVLVNPFADGIPLPTSVKAFIRGQNSDTPIPWRHAPQLPRVVTPEEHTTMLELLTGVTQLLNTHNITHIIAFGTLMGSYMFHDILPWDDDMDILISWADIPKLKQLLAEPQVRQTFGVHTWKNIWIGKNEYDLETLQSFPKNSPDSLYYQLSATDTTHKIHTLYHWFKIYKKDSKPAGKKEWNWPFVDMTFYKENETHVWYFEKNPELFALPKKDFYPLIERPLGEFKFKAPRNPGLFLKTRYKNFRCSKQDYTHRTERRLWPWQHGEVDCSDIYPYYPMVYPRQAPDGIVTEQLRLVSSGEVIQTVDIPGQQGAFISRRPFDF